MDTKKRILATLVLGAALLIQAPAAFAQFAWLRNPVRDVERMLERKLDDQEIEIVEYIVTFYAVKYDETVKGKSFGKAVRSMTNEEYKYAVGKAAEAADSEAAKFLFKTGKVGETGIKALLQLLGETVEDAGKFFEEKASEYDNSHK